MSNAQRPLQYRSTLFGKDPLTTSEGFVFTSNTGTEWASLHHYNDPAGDRVTVAWLQGSEKNPLGQAKYEEFKTYAKALRRLADVIEGKVSFLDFGNKRV